MRKYRAILEVIRTGMDDRFLLKTGELILMSGRYEVLDPESLE